MREIQLLVYDIGEEVVVSKIETTTQHVKKNLVKDWIGHTQLETFHKIYST